MMSLSIPSKVDHECGHGWPGFMSKGQKNPSIIDGVDVDGSYERGGVSCDEITNMDTSKLTNQDNTVWA